MKVMIVARGYPSEKYKMNGIFEFDQAKALVKLGINVVYAVIDVRSIRRWRKWGIERKVVQGVNIYALNLPLGRIPKPILRIISELGLDYLYKKIIKDLGSPNVVHAHFTEMGYLTSKLKLKYNFPLVFTEHYSQIMKEKIEPKLFEIARHTYISSDAVIAVSIKLKQIIQDKFYVDAEYIPNIVDTELFKYTSKERLDNYKFVSVGNLKYVKRMDLLIEAFILAFQNNNNVSLTIFGEGSERRNLESLIKKSNMEDQIVLKGMQSRQVIAEFLSKSDCFVLASQSETFGVAYVEAMASGLPVIATKCGGPESFVNQENGILIPVNDMNTLIKSMKLVYENKIVYNNDQIALNTKQEFSGELVAKRIIKVYKNMI